jgi:probable rRNA maturation factor
MAVGDALKQSVPDEASIKRWANAALEGAKTKTATTLMTVRVVELDEISQLNEVYRQKNGPTNVLSFPFVAEPGMPAEIAEEMDAELGDVVVCAAVVAREANEQKKTVEEHWAHMIVHGTLHLLGYDHIKDADAKIMESLEVAVLGKLGFADPYS